MATTVNSNITLPVFTGEQQVEQICLSYDASDGDYTVKAAVTDRPIYVYGISYALTSPHTLTFKSGSSTIASYNLDPVAAKDGLAGGAFLFTEQGEALVFSCSASITITLLVGTSDPLAFGVTRS